ncbi:exopolysaccharide biosynthesis polyprenyl glycosylphosphotransferase [Erythrobacter sp. SDW2]|uniref:exopolysaccharide biosynthesis polyprenyl glycosylphosphotransferase n=1 Tax=Erythrobacter sp. SDW2 TaxID=2907154 RepID=UPI001F1C3551|nr:exopolysaccharide biosynthesis polyprenyl glycosylphosphotransferase [Erythrobacter sp. SDW2]UIP07176.1 exopolysaccharide biosynthesis polyprenyl glycosylphosphotransferase [Erythrobacter sp. SDW2]
MNAPAKAEHGTAKAAPTLAIAPAPSLERRRLRAYLMLVAVDVVLILAGFLLAGQLYLGRLPDPQAMRQAYLLLPIFLTIAMYQGTYSIRTLLEWRYATVRVLLALAISAALLAFVAFYLKTSATFSRVTLTLGLALSAGMMVAVRALAVAMVRRRWQGFVRNRLLVLDGGPKLEIGANRIIDAASLGLDPTAEDPHALDRLGHALLHQDEVVVSCPSQRREHWAWALKASGVRGEIVSEMAHDLGALGVRRYDMADVTTLVVSAGPLGLRSRAMKRAFDIALALGGLLLLSPLLLLVAMLVWLEDRGSVLFVQQRTGRGNRFFPMLKFRSMKVQQTDADGCRSTGRDDDRLTRIGGLLRRTSIDELPQLVNVLRGEMSIVGPRPHAAGSLAGDKAFWQVDSRYWHRHALKPGLTGLAQVRGLRGATDEERDLSERLQADLEYLVNWSLWGDLGIVLRTVLVLRHDRAF